MFTIRSAEGLSLNGFVTHNLGRSSLRASLSTQVALTSSIRIRRECVIAPGEKTCDAVIKHARHLIDSNSLLIPSSSVQGGAVKWQLLLGRGGEVRREKGKKQMVEDQPLCSGKLQKSTKPCALYIRTASPRTGWTSAIPSNHIRHGHFGAAHQDLRWSRLTRQFILRL